MERKLVLEFTKMNGAGNDFIVIDNRFYHFKNDELSDLARRLCQRRFGIGADGILAFAYPDDEAHHYRMIYYNADGSRGSMCGNGARCLARFAHDAGLGGRELVFESDAGIYRALVDASDLHRVRLFVQPPTRYESEMALAQTPPDELSAAYYLWPGVEHLIFFVPNLDSVPVDTWGRTLRSDTALGPAGANVNFVQVLEGEPEPRIRVRTFEKGVEAETLACGTGAIASAVVAHLTHRVSRTPVGVHMPGGVLQVGFQVRGEEVSDVYLEGPVDVVYRGSVYV